MRSPLTIVRALRDARRRRLVKLPWAELETEAARQGCSAADIFFDWSGREVGEPARTEPDGGRRHRRLALPRASSSVVRGDRNRRRLPG